jgi:hypothetical protein
MIPFQGCLADVLALVALFRLWTFPPRPIWWALLAGIVLDGIGKAMLRESIKTYGGLDSCSKQIAGVLMVVQLGVIGAAIYGLFF